LTFCVVASLELILRACIVVNVRMPCGDVSRYAWIAARSGFTPMIFMTRVRLQTSTCRDISVATFGRRYLALLEQKTKALDQAAPLDDWRLADCVYRLRRLMEARMGTVGRREFIQVLRLMEKFHQHQVEQAVQASACSMAPQHATREGSEGHCHAASGLRSRCWFGSQGDEEN
jgi:hypothetical protein